MAVLLTSDGGEHWTRVAPSSLPRAESGEGSFAASGTCLTTGPEGRAWIVMSPPARSRLLRTHEGSGAQSVTFRDAQHGMVFGGGDRRRPQDAPSFRVGTWGARTPTVVAVGPSGSAWSADLGGSWVPIDTANYWTVGFAAGRTGWAVGTQGRVTRLSGW